MAATKGIVAALTVIALVVDLILNRGSADPALDAHDMDMLNVIRMLVVTHCQFRIYRKLNIKKVVHSLLGKELIKEKRYIYGELPEPSDFLLGYNLGEKNRELVTEVSEDIRKLLVFWNALQREAPHDVGVFKREVRGCWSFPSIQRS